MNQKFEITKLVLNLLKLDSSNSNIKKILPVWWVNPRSKPKGGLGLTEKGFDSFVKADLKSHEINFEEIPILDNGLILWLDQNLDSPFYLTHRKIWVFSEKTAIQLVLFSGNLKKLQQAHKRFIEKSKSN